jgi:hypothetical protein
MIKNSKEEINPTLGGCGNLIRGGHMFEIFSIWWKGQQNPEQAKNVETTSAPQECFTYVYSLKRGEKLNLDDYFTGKKNNEYKTLISTENGRADVDKCVLYADLSILMKMLSSRHSVPPADLYILRFNCMSKRSKTTNFIVQLSKHMTT